jgi:hypothetical protein
LIQKKKLELTFVIILIDSLQPLLFRKLNERKNNYNHNDDNVVNKDNEIVSILFLVFLNSKIYNNEDAEKFKTIHTYLSNVTHKDMTVLDHLILFDNECFSNECFSNDDLIYLNDEFENEKKKPSNSTNSTNTKFLIKKPECIEALCQRNDYSTFKKIFNLNKLDDKVENPKKFIRSINFLKCFDIALKKDNEKIAKFLLKILSFYTFYSKTQDSKNVSKIDKIDDKDSKNISKIDEIDEEFNTQFIDYESLNKLDIIKLINTLSEFFEKNPKKEKYRDGNEDENENKDGDRNMDGNRGRNGNGNGNGNGDGDRNGDGTEKAVVEQNAAVNWHQDCDRDWHWDWDMNWNRNRIRNWDKYWVGDGDEDWDGDWDGPKEQFEGGYKFFLDMEKKYFKYKFRNLSTEIAKKLKTFNEIFLIIFLEAFFQLEWFEAIEFFFDQCKKYTEVESKIKKDNKNKNIKGNVKKDGEFLPFFCFNEIGYIKRLQKKKKTIKLNRVLQVLQKIQLQNQSQYHFLLFSFLNSSKTSMTNQLGKSF